MKHKIPNLVTILILTTLTAVMWISLNIYRAVTVKPSPAVPKEISEPLDPNLDLDAIQAIQSGLFLSEEQIPVTVIVSATPSPSPTSRPSPSPSPTVSPSPVPEESPIPISEEEEI